MGNVHYIIMIKVPFLSVFMYILTVQRLEGLLKMQNSLMVFKLKFKYYLKILIQKLLSLKIHGSYLYYSILHE